MGAFSSLSMGIRIKPAGTAVSSLLRLASPFFLATQPRGLMLAAGGSGEGSTVVRGMNGAL